MVPSPAIPMIGPSDVLIRCLLSIPKPPRRRASRSRHGRAVPAFPSRFPSIPSAAETATAFAGPVASTISQRARRNTGGVIVIRSAGG